MLPGDQTGTGPRVFSIEEANALVPQLIELVGEQLDKGKEIQALAERLYERIGDGETVGVLDIRTRAGEDDEVARLKRDLAQRIARYRRGWADVQALGAVVKDTKQGMLDFYGRVDNRLVWLCWRFGETAIEHYHDLDAGFTGRKPLSGDALRHSLN